MDMLDTALIELRLKNCDPNEEDCSHVLDEEFKDYGVNNLGFSALFKIVIPDLLAAVMFYHHYSKNKSTIKDFKYVKMEMGTSELISMITIDVPEGDQMAREKKGNKDDNSYVGQFRTWWRDNGFTQHNWAWFQIAAAADFLYNGQVWLFFLWKIFGWLPSWQKFYIEHIVSNMNWGVYAFGTWQMIVAAIDDNSWQAYTGLLVWLSFAWMFGFSEFRLGTDAIRYLDTNYYADTRLYPSMLYLFGLMDHEYQPEDEDFESDPSADQDIILEDIALEERSEDEEDQIEEEADKN